MKKLLLTIGLASAMTAGAFAQGTFVFANGGANVNAPITSINGGSHLIPTGTTYTIGYYWSTSGTVGAGGLLVGGTFGATTVNPTLANGYFFGSTTSIAGQTGTVFIQPVVWTTSAGSLSGAIVDPLAEWGAFNPVPVTLATGPIQPSQLAGLAPLTLDLLEVVPEPATIALAGLGAMGWLLFRRRK